MQILNFLRDAWAYLEPITWFCAIVIGGSLFLRDHVRRDIFWGFIPTVITVVIDPSEQTLLVGYLREKNVWILPQGRIKRGSIIESGQNVLFRELNLDRMNDGPGLYLGRLPLRGEEKSRLSRFMEPDEFSLFPEPRGKSYTALTFETKQSSAQAKMEGDQYEELKFVSLADARDLLSRSHKNGKMKFYIKVLDQLERQFN